MRASSWPFTVAIALTLSCAGAQKNSEYPDAESEPEEAEATTDSASGENEGNSGDGEPAGGADEASNAAAPAAEPAFTPDMSVDQAQAAVPVGTERQNIEQEALGRPLQEPGVFDACKIGSARFKVRVAVWNGKAVGVDLETTPKNAALAECLKARVRELTWPDKVRSLNTVEFQF
jgi:hypothetical protein